MRRKHLTKLEQPLAAVKSTFDFMMQRRRGQSVNRGLLVDELSER